MRETNDAYEALLKGALARIEALEAEVEQARGRAADPEPIAVVGMGCRFPGADGPDAYWRLLTEGRDAVVEVPADRWDVDAYYDPDPDAPGKMSTRYGGFLDGVAEFDAALFGVSAREAASIDPQQRLLLEVSWAAFEDAGMPVRSLPARTGVFVGISNVDYREAMVSHGAEHLDGYFSSGSTTSTASGRLSYFLGLTGPALSVDTACSSSLVSVHLAVMNLRSGACDMALAGGVNQIVTPHETISLSKGRMMSPDGRCKPFDAAANGYVRAEGCGMVVLKRLSDARRDGDRVLAVVRGGATNQDGHRSGLTVPHGPSQQDVVRRALEDSRVEPHQVGYVEAHGTGTALGDPIEAAALGAVFDGRPRPLAVGSVKSNFGHLESAAGIAGVIKAVLAVREAAIPPTLHFDTPNPLIDWDTLPLRVPTALEPWTEERRVAGVSSFGFSGTNCHLVLESAPQEEPAAGAPARPLHVLTVSGATAAALDEATTRMAAFLADGAGGADLADVCATANSGRSHLDHRRAVVAATAGELVQRLTEGGPGSFDGHVQGRRSVPEVAFLFTGQGSQYPGMGRELYESQPAFRQAVDECAAVLDPLLGRSLTGLLYPDGAQPAGDELDRTGYTQPALFAVEYALARLWRSWGVEPQVVLGHSVGEYVAACVAGVFSLSDALRLVAERGRLMQELPAGGVMVSLRGRPEVVEAAVAGHPLVSVAAVNGPEEVVVAGDAGQVEQVVAELARQGVTGRALRVSHAFHSPLMEPVTAPLTALARTVRYSAPRIRVISNVTGEAVGADRLCDPEYWARHALAPVRFADGIRAAHAGGARAFVEIGPKPVLLGLVRACLPDADDAVLLPSLRPDRDLTELLGSAAALHVRGVPVDWAAVDGRPRPRRVALPTYPFQRERHWFTEETAPGARPLPADDDWLVGVRWEETTEDNPPAPTGHWHITGTTTDVDLGPHATTVTDPTDADHHLYLPDPTDHTTRTTAEHTHHLTTELLALVHHLTTTGTRAHLHVITRHAHPLTPHDHPDPAHTALWGLVRTINAEHPELHCTITDTDPHTTPHHALTTHHPHSALRGTTRHTPTLTPTTNPTPHHTDPVELSGEGSYLVTGGLGGLGLQVARRLAEQGAGHLVLAGRTPRDTEDVRAAVRAMEDAGARVHLLTADVSRPADVERLVDRAHALAPLRGIVHAAGVLDDGVLAGQTPERFHRVLAPKVDGAHALDRITRERGIHLDFFTAFSSVAALLPTLGSGAYGAANAYLDGLMARRRSLGLPGLAVNWGPWAEVGMAADEGDAYDRIGLRMLPADQGSRLAVRLARTGRATHEVAVLAADWRRFRTALGEDLPAGYLARLGATAEGAVTAPGGRPDRAADTAPPSARQELAAAADPRAFLASWVERTLRAVLGSRAPIGPHQGFFSLGMDSLMTVEFRSRIAAGLDLKLATTVAFTYPTLDELVGFLARELGLTADAAAPVRARGGAAERQDAPPAPAAPTGDAVGDLMARISQKYQSHRNA